MHYKLNKYTKIISLINYISHSSQDCIRKIELVVIPGLEVIKLEFILRLEIKCNDWLLADTCPQAANHRALF